MRERPCEQSERATERAKIGLGGNGKLFGYGNIVENNHILYVQTYEATDTEVAYFSSKGPKTDFHFSKAKGGPEKWGKFSYWTLK